jgi:hypothetical protein
MSKRRGSMIWKEISLAVVQACVCKQWVVRGHHRFCLCWWTSTIFACANNWFEPVLLGNQSAMGRKSRLPACWLAQVDEQLSTYNLCIDSDQLPPCARLKQLAERQYIVHHQVAAADSSRVRAYLGLNSSTQYGYKEYLSRVDNAQLRRSLARFRCANHTLQIELGRQAKPVKVPVQQRYCKLCNLGAVEDEDHFLLVCPAYQSFRERFRGSLPLTAITPLAELLSCQQQGILARFLVQCQTVRSELLHQT